jgi:peptidoglycan/LPS O-acetylase OafA/YrhL
MSLIKYRSEIDGLRAVAIISVFLFHLEKNWLSGGFVGVDVFFVISGYLIASILLKQLENRSFSLSAFYQRRIARIFPAFFAVSVFTLVSARFIYSDQDYASAGSVTMAANLFLANMKFMVQGNYFELSPDAQPFLHYWSLAVEEQFYLIFPISLLLTYHFKVSQKKIFLFILSILFMSLTGCILLTEIKPVWAFYLLPTRSWEILAGCALAAYKIKSHSITNPKRTGILSNIGLAAILLSLFLINEHQKFPGFIALLPVLGTVLILNSQGEVKSLSERLLSVCPLPLIGRLSYSLYLWHWPIFSFIDYGMYTAPNSIRLFLKVILSAFASIFSYYFLEQPARHYFNQPRKQLISFALAVSVAIVLVASGNSIRNNNYINANLTSVSNGGIVVNGKIRIHSIVLMGDSNGSMYGKMVKGIAKQLHIKANIISTAAGNPLPDTALWRKSLSVIQQENPNVTVVAISWLEQLAEDKERIKRAIQEILKHSDYIILITQPPILPEDSTRDSIRQFGVRPIIEDPIISKNRKETNQFIKSLANHEVIVLDIESLFVRSNGEIIFSNKKGQQLYQDTGHLSGYGSDRVGTLLLDEIAKHIGKSKAFDKNNSVKSDSLIP